MKQSLITSFVRLFGRVPEVVSQAPGRIEFIGNHTDYNGGVVMGVALDKTVMVDSCYHFVVYCPDNEPSAYSDSVAPKGALIVFGL